MPDILKNLQPERLREEIGQMIDALTSPPFVQAMRQVRSAPISQRLVEGSRRLNPDVLREQGVPFPPNMRISSRYFEEGLPRPVDFGDASNGRVNLVNALNEAVPGLLDRLRAEKSDVFQEIVAANGGLDYASGEASALAATPSIGGCCCGGGATVCGGCGGD